MRRILVVLPNWYGETLFATPFLRAIRLQYPDAYLATLGWPQCREILLNNPRVSALIDYDERTTHKDLWSKWRLIAQLRSFRFDTAFVLRKSLSRTLLLAAAQIPMRVGFANSKSGWLLTHKAPVCSGPIHKAASYFSLLEVAGLTLLKGPYEYWIEQEERCFVGGWLRQQGLLDGHRLVVLHPAANWAHKRWPPERFAQLADHLAQTRQVCIAITGGADDRPLAEALARQMKHPAWVLAGRTQLRQLAAILERACLVVANDTGVLHLAAALNRPVVALYGPTSPVLTGPLGDPRRTIVLHHSDSCPRIPCYGSNHPGYPGMDAISVDEAYAAAVQLMESMG